ncbi:V-type ATP synthase subunit D [Metallosphaera sp. J1]|uniref:V-type ATP synthase subunit D n=1 Tax=Metallosphaera TaxID=41980 RepID=UPI001EDEBC75|nr:V-type ATP synthase subunit D [Metallosphaera javensis (ex Hofmann et al. 2022)]MCG3108702.1 V-type ATP synthase subunit D [Metallosphaera javensis (ex Hofmann et al. 2022)]BCS91610.1 MAG: V-type ATP synthase subunit D [Metallosphaera javensis (ex Sakai et al. 2022)]
MSSRRVLPTKINLISMRNQLKLIRVIKRLLENKREVLLIYLRTYVNEYEKIYNEVNEALKVVYDSYMKAVVDEGIGNIETIANSQTSSLQLKSSTKVIFGVKIPITELSETSIPPKPFSEVETSPYLSEAYDRMRETMIKVIKLVELESTIRSLVAELRRTQRLINAIDTSILPFYNNSVKYIRSILNDRSREEFVRLKVTRRILQRRRGDGR